MERIALVGLPGSGANRSSGIAAIAGESSIFQAFREGEPFVEGLVRELHDVLQASNQAKDLRR